MLAHVVYILINWRKVIFYADIEPRLISFSKKNKNLKTVATNFIKQKKTYIRYMRAKIGKKNSMGNAGIFRG